MDSVPNPTDFTFELVKLQKGIRVLRVSDPSTGTCLERVVNPDLPVAQQKNLLQRALRSLLQGVLKGMPA